MPRIIARIYLGIFWAAGALPTFVLWREFGEYQLKNCGGVVSYFAKLYSHFFVYPITFGLASTICLIYPLGKCIDYLLNLPNPDRKRKITAIAFFFLLTVVGPSCLEFSKATPALWEFPPARTLGTNKEDTLFRTFLENRCEKLQWKEETPEEHEQAQATRKEFTKYLKELRGTPNTRSSTDQAYRVGFVGRFTLFMTLLMTLFIAITAPKEVRQPMIPRLTYALIFASFWVLMRIAYMTEKYTIYDIEDDQLFVFNGIIFLVFLVGYIHLFTISKDSSQGGDNTNRVFLGIFGALELFFGAVGITDWMPYTLVRLFGTKSDPVTYMIIFLFLFVVFFPTILRTLEDTSKVQPS